MNVSKVWVVEHGEGHWAITLGDTTITCDPGEVNETVAELVALAGELQV